MSTIDNFDVRLASTEQEFIYRYGVNRGHSLSFSKVNRCLFLSSQAKQLYANLCDYVFEGKNDCYPSQATLRLGLGWSKGTLNTYLTELREVGLVTCEQQGAGKPLRYVLNELCNVICIRHSEMVYSLRPSTSAEIEKFHSKVNDYRQTELFKEMQQSPDLDRIKSWFSTPDELPHSNTLPTVIPVSAEAVEEVQKQRRKRKSFKDIPVEEWGTNHLCDYFGSLYQEELGVPYMVTVADRACIKRLLQAKTPEILQEHIENFIQLDFFDAKNIKGFSSSYCQSVLDQYLVNGTLPSYRKKPKVKMDDSWAAGLDNFFKQEG